jgi:hypothetical protein
MQAHGFQFCGNCLGAVIPNGSNVEVDPSLEIRPLDVVAVLLDPEAGGAFAGFINGIGAGGFMGVCKIYLGSHQSRQDAKPGLFRPLVCSRSTRGLLRRPGRYPSSHGS